MNKLQTKRRVLEWEDNAKDDKISADEQLKEFEEGFEHTKDVAEASSSVPNAIKTKKVAIDDTKKNPKIFKVEQDVPEHFDPKPKEYTEEKPLVDLHDGEYTHSVEPHIDEVYFRLGKNPSIVWQKIDGKLEEVEPKNLLVGKQFKQELVTKLIMLLQGTKECDDL